MRVHETDPQKLVERAAERLGITKPAWASFVKTGTGRQRPPDQPNWWSIRAASVLRTFYVSYPRPVGIQRLRTRYGSKKNLGHQPTHYRRGSGKILRTIVQELEKKNYIRMAEKKGRIITPEGMRFLDAIAAEIK